MRSLSNRNALLTAFALVLLCTFATAQVIPEKTQVKVVLSQSISSEKAKTGDPFDAVLAEDLVVNGKTIAKKGDPVTGKITFAKASGRLSEPGQLTLHINTIKNIKVTSSAVARKGASHTKSNSTKIGGGAVAGALIGGLVGGGKGAAVGAGAGAGAGTGVAAATGKKDVTITAETKLTFSVHSN